MTPENEPPLDELGYEKLLRVRFLAKQWRIPKAEAVRLLEGWGE